MFSKHITLTNVCICSFIFNVLIHFFMKGMWKHECVNCPLTTEQSAEHQGSYALAVSGLSALWKRKEKKHKMYVIVMKSWRTCYLLHFYLQHICVHMPFLGKDPWGKWCLRQQWLEVFSQAPATAVRWKPHLAASDRSGNIQ